jgi:hypothetical protein
MEQIIPIKEAEEFVISMANKSREEVGTQELMKERHIVRRKFWTAYLKEINKTTSLYQNVSPSKDHWISAGSGISGATFTSVVTGDYIRIELSIHGKTQEENKVIFDALVSQKESIETAFGNPLEWERLTDKRMSRIKFELQGVSVFNEEDWQKMFAFMGQHVPKFEAAFKKPIQLLSRK